MFLLRNVLLSVGNHLFSSNFFKEGPDCWEKAGRGHAALLVEDTGNVLKVPLGILQFVHSSFADVTRKVGLPVVR